MNLKTKVKQLERMSESNMRAFIRGLPEAELERMSNEYKAKYPILFQLHTEWLDALSDEEIEILCSDKPKGKIIWKRFDEYKREKGYKGEACTA